MVITVADTAAATVVDFAAVAFMAEVFMAAGFTQPPALSMAEVFMPHVPLLPAVSGMVQYSVMAAVFIARRSLPGTAPMGPRGSIGIIIATSGLGSMARFFTVTPAPIITATRRSTIMGRGVSAA
ncbi:MAG TPA: hypothetical protein VHC94_09505 [Nitrobacter sp.]|nr:hypothetical protein [Nitrobacter sp.]